MTSRYNTSDDEIDDIKIVGARCCQKQTKMHDDDDQFFLSDNCERLFGN